MSRPVGPYSPSVRAGDWLVVSGQVGHDAGVLADGLAGQIGQAFTNLRAVLADAGARLDQVVKTTVFLTDIADYGEMNEHYIAEFGDHRPARSAVAVAALPLGARFEVEAWVWLG